MPSERLSEVVLGLVGSSVAATANLSMLPFGLCLLGNSLNLTDRNLAI